MRGLGAHSPNQISSLHPGFQASGTTKSRFVIAIGGPPSLFANDVDVAGFGRLGTAEAGHLNVFADERRTPAKPGPPLSMFPKKDVLLGNCRLWPVGLIVPGAMPIAISLWCFGLARAACYKPQKQLASASD